MRNSNEKNKVNVLTLAVQGALIGMFAFPMTVHAEDAFNDETTALTHPSNSVELGLTNVPKDSAKFGEYNGLNKSGVYGIANINLRGGSAYDGGDGTTRWQIKGVDLGTTSRSMDGVISNQGQWNAGIGYDELQHNISDSYQTPLQGSAGGNNFTMPSNFGTINTGKADDGTQLSGSKFLDKTQLGDFHTEKVGTSRKNTSFTAGYTFTPQWSVQFDYNHLDQSGAKLIGSSSQGGQANGTGTWKAEGVNILLNPTSYKTDTFNLALNWAGEKGHLTGGYYGSFFRDDYNSLNWENAFVTGYSAASGSNPAIAATPTCPSGGTCSYQLNSMSTAPDNSFHQLNLTGGYAFSSTTKLAGGLSYGRNIQNDAYANTTGFGMMQSGVPQSSLNGLVVTSHADFKLTNQTTKDLTLSAAMKYNERDNQSTSNAYNYIILGVGNYTGVNTPYSNKKTQYEVAADYKLTKGQNIRVAYEHESIDRWCDHLASGHQCVASPSSGEDKLNLTYRVKVREDINFNAGYSYANRNAEFDHTFLSPIATGTLTPLGGVNAKDYLGFLAFPYASRKQDLVKTGLNWQATDKLDVGLNSRYSHENYDATLGMQNGRTIAFNLDANYNFNENGSLGAYASWQNAQTGLRDGNNNSVTVAPTNIWSNQLKSDSNAFGLNAKKHGLMAGKLELLGDLSYSLDNSKYSTQQSYNPTTCGGVGVLTCGDTPDIKTRVKTLKLTGNYQLDKHGKVALGYIFQQMKSNDYLFNAEQYGYTATSVMPTNQQLPNYSVNVVSATYIYTF